MRELAIDCSIDGHRYSSDLLARIDYHRHVHVLHDMRRLGASIEHRGQTLSDDDINRLNPEDARQVCISTRKSYDVAGIRKLYADQLRSSDQMWKDANEASDGAPLLPAIADVSVTGITVDEILSYTASPRDMGLTYAELNPDHYFFCDHAAGAHVMETFGMYGGPTETYVTVDPTITAPIEPEPGYSLLTAGYTTLASDGSNINAVALHQIKPLKHGLAIKLGAFFPPKTPKELVDGHKLHMAIEAWQMCKLVAASD